MSPEQRRHIYDEEGRPVYDEQGRPKWESEPKPLTARRGFFGSAFDQLNPINMAAGLVQMGKDAVGGTITAGSRALQGDLTGAARAAVGAIPVVGQEARRIRDVWTRPDSGDPRVDATRNRVAESVPILGGLARIAADQARDDNYAGAAGTMVAGVGGLFFGPKAVNAAAGRLAPIIRPAAERGASSRIVDVIAPKTGHRTNKARFGNMANDEALALAKEPGMGALSREGLHRKVSGRLDDAGGLLDEAADARNAGHVMETQPVLDALQRGRQALAAEAVEGSLPARAMTTRASSILDEHGRPIQVDEWRRVPIGADQIPAPSQPRTGPITQAAGEVEGLGEIARYDSLRRIRQSYDGPAKLRYHPSLTADFLKKTGESAGAADVTHAIRQALAGADEGTAAANKVYSRWKTLQDVLDATAETERVRPNRAGPILSRAAGAAAGGVASKGVGGALAGALAGDFANRIASSGFTPKIMTARALARLPDQLQAGMSSNAIRAAILAGLLNSDNR